MGLNFDTLRYVQRAQEELRSSVARSVRAIRGWLEPLEVDVDTLARADGHGADDERLAVVQVVLDRAAVVQRRLVAVEELHLDPVAQPRQRPLRHALGTRVPGAC